MKNLKLFKSGFCEKLKLLLIPIGLLIGNFTMHAWAGEWDDPMWQVWGWKTGYANDGWLASSMGPGTDYNIGTITSDEYYLKGLSAQTKNDASVDKVHCYITYPNGTKSDYYIDYSSNWDSGKKKYWESKGVWGGGYHIVNTQDPGDYTIDLYFKMKNSGDEYAENHRKITWTIPGFNPTTNETSFGTTIPVNTESETTISFNHYGSTSVSASSSYSIMGTNRTEFEVRSIRDGEVKVAFIPTTTGSKTATLTITDGYSKTFTITLTGTAVAKGTTTRLYFNSYNYNSNWTDGSASSRFTVEYTSGVYTYFPMTQCANSSYNYYADVEIKEKTVSVDRYNASTHEYYNTASITGINASNPYAVLDNLSGGIFYGFATNHPYNDVSGGNIYYDNSKSGLTNTIYLVVGHDYKMADGGGDKEYSKGYALENIPNTKLYYGTFADTWHDADYYAFIGASSAPSAGEWGSNDLSSKASSSSYTGIFREVMDLESGSSYLGLAPSKTGGALSMTKSPTLNTTQTFNYALSTDGGGTYTAMTSGAPNTPGQLSMSAYQFTSAACTAVEAKSAQTLSANATTYSKEVSNVAYTGTTTLTASEKRDGYTFVGWYNTTTGSPTLRTSNASFTYYPQGDSTYTAYYKAHRYTINFDANDAQYSSAPAATGTMDPMTNVVYDQNATLTANGFHRIGYKFEGWATTAGGPVAYADEATDILILTTTDGGSATLYAKWSTDVNTFTNAGKDGAWGNAANWSAGIVPENDDAIITINQPVTISGGSYHIGELSFGASGSLTIAADGALEVAGTIINTDANKIVINSTTTNQGALIFNSTGTTAATVNMTMNAASDKFQFIAIPVPYINVADKFPGSTVYTYGWSNTKHEWERRGYYDGFSSFEAVLVKGQGSALFSGNLVATGERVCGGTYNADDYGYVYMYGNSWTAPIKMSAEGFSNASIGIMKGSANSWDGVIAGQVIPALQAFAVAVNDGGGSITINYDRDVRNPSTPNVPLKAPKHQMSETQEPITVYVSGNEMQTRIRLFEDATRFSDEFDNGWEALYMEGYGYAGEMYAMGTDKMNVLATNNLEGTVVGFVPGQAENYTISFAGDGKGYYLNDMKEEESTLIEEGNTYVFTPDESTNSTRFVISRTPVKKTPTSVDNINDGVKARKQMIDGTLYIIRDGRIYNAEGSLVK